MIEAASITAVVTLLSKGRGLLRELRQSSLADKHKAQLSELEDDFTDISDRLFEFQSALLQLNQENERLRKELSLADDWNSRRNKYELFQTREGAIVWRSKEGIPQHYVCPTCAESKHEFHPLQNDGSYAGTFSCRSCKSDYSFTAPKPPTLFVG